MSTTEETPRHEHEPHHHDADDPRRGRRRVADRRLAAPRGRRRPRPGGRRLRRGLAGVGPGRRPPAGRDRRGRQRGGRHRHRGVRRRPRSGPGRPGHRARRGLPGRRRAARHEPPPGGRRRPRGAHGVGRRRQHVGRRARRRPRPTGWPPSSAPRPTSAWSATRSAAASAGWPAGTDRPATPSARSRSSRPTARSCGPVARRTPSCSGRCAAAPAACGVVTDMEIALVPVTDVYAGNLYYPAEAAAEVVARWSAWVADAPAELTSAVVLTNEPPAPDLPEELRGRSFTIVRGCWCGPVDEGRALLDDVAGDHAARDRRLGRDAVRRRRHDQPGPGRPRCRSSAPAAGSTGRRTAPRSAPCSRPTRSPTEGRPRSCSARSATSAAPSPPAIGTHTTMGNRDRRFLLQMTGRPTAPADAAAIEAHLRATKAALGDEPVRPHVPQLPHRRRAPLLRADGPRRRRPAGHRRDVRPPRPRRPPALRHRPRRLIARAAAMSDERREAAHRSPDPAPQPRLRRDEAGGRLLGRGRPAHRTGASVGAAPPGPTPAGPAAAAVAAALHVGRPSGTGRRSSVVVRRRVVGRRVVGRRVGVVGGGRCRRRRRAVVGARSWWCRRRRTAPTRCRRRRRSGRSRRARPPPGACGSWEPPREVGWW